jgi:predicted ester cyclase
MSTEDNKAITRRMYEEIHNKANLAAADALIAANFVDHNAPEPGIPGGPEGVKQTFSIFHAAFPDFSTTVEDMIAEGDKVVARLTMRGAHKGELMGIAPTGKQVTIGVIDVVRITGGKIAERWGQEDMLGMMQQLGVVPTPG